MRLQFEIVGMKVSHNEMFILQSSFFIPGKVKYHEFEPEGQGGLGKLS